MSRTIRYSTYLKWKAHLEAFDKSPLSMTAYCKKHHICRPGFFYIYKAFKEGKIASPAEKKSKPCKKKTDPALEFIKVVME